MKFIDTAVKNFQDKKTELANTLSDADIQVTATRVDDLDLSKLTPQMETDLMNASAVQTWDNNTPWLKYAMWGAGAWLIWKYVLKK